MTLKTRRDGLLECSQALGHGNPAAKYGVHARSSRFSPVLPIGLCRHSGHALRALPLRRPVDAGTQAQGSQQVRPALTAGAATWVLGHNLRLLGYSLRPARCEGLESAKFGGSSLRRACLTLRVCLREPVTYPASATSVPPCRPCPLLASQPVPACIILLVAGALILDLPSRGVLARSVHAALAHLHCPGLLTTAQLCATTASSLLLPACTVASSHSPDCLAGASRTWFSTLRPASQAACLRA